MPIVFVYNINLYLIYLYFIRTCSDAMQNLQLNTGSQAQTINLRHKFETLLNQVKDFDSILMNLSDTSEIVIIISL